MLFGAGTPLAKLLLSRVDPWLLAGLLYLGSGIGLTLYRRLSNAPTVGLPRHEWPWFAGAIVAGGIVGPVLLMLAGAMVVGFLAYGVSLALFVVGLRHLGTARTGAYFTVAPFFGAVLAIPLLGEPVSARLLSAAALMALGVWLHLTEQHSHPHLHEAMEHEHEHDHVHDAHHAHPHDARAPTGAKHRHRHRHEPLAHSHAHFPDAHHRHRH